MKANIGDRLKYLKNNDWDSFYEACGEDKVNTPIMELALSLQEDNTIYCVTGRRKSTRRKTLDWLTSHGLYVDRLFMRADGDHRKDTFVKLELMRGLNADLIFEDRASMVKAWRDDGFTCCQVAEGVF